MLRLYLFSLLMLTSTTVAHAADDLLAELDEVYLAVFVDVIKPYENEELRYCVGVGNHEETGLPIAIPPRQWKKLKPLLVNKGIDVSKFVPAAEVGWDDEKDHLIHKPTGKPLYYYSIDRIVWRGNQQLRVRQSLYHSGLNGRGSTAIVEKRNGKWIVVKHVDVWLS